MLAAVNAARAEARTCGADAKEAAPPLTLDPRLTTAAQLHTEDYAQNGSAVPGDPHVGSDGSSVEDRIRRQGYDPEFHGENIFSGYGGFADSIDKAIAWWLASPGHCSNIMNADYTELGVGHYFGTNIHFTNDDGVAQEGNFWTQVFAIPD